MLSGAKNQLIVGIPPVVRLSPVVVEPRLAVLVPVHIEHVRVAVRVVNYAESHPYHCPSNSVERKENRLYFIWKRNFTSLLHQVFSFFGQLADLPRKALTVRALNLGLPEKFREAVTARYNLSILILPKNRAKQKCQRNKISKL